MELTIGQVSGIIAAVVFVVQLLTPNALALILVAVLKDRHTAVTWSVVQRHILSTHWPILLQSDTAGSKGVAKRVKIVTWLRPIALLLVSIAAIVTPLGLHSAIAPDSSVEMAQFTYLADSGPMGYGTPIRSNVRYTRSCGDGVPMYVSSGWILLPLAE